MAEPGPSAVPDPMWQEFDTAGRAGAEKLEAEYQVIEGYNAHMLNQVAGLEDAGYTFVAPLGSDMETPPPDLSKVPVTNATLYLRPDTRELLHEQNESPEVIHAKGDPYTITGEVPDRTQKMLDDMFAGTEAVLDKDASTPNEEVWRGNVAGQPIRFVKYMHTLERHVLDKVVASEPTLLVRVFREQESFGTQTSRTVVESLHADGINLPTEQIDGIADTVQKATDESLQRTRRRMNRPGWLKRFLGH